MTRSLLSTHCLVCCQGHLQPHRQQRTEVVIPWHGSGAHAAYQNWHLQSVPGGLGQYSKVASALTLCLLPGHIHTYQPSSNQWSKHDVQHGDSLVLCRHTATAHGQQLYCLGGGMNCFGFGTTFSPPMQLDLTSLQQQSSQQPADSPDSQLPSGKTLAPAAVPILASSTKGNKPGTSPGGSKRPPQVNWKQAGLHPMRHADNAVDQATQPQTYAPAVSSASTVNYAVTPGVVSGRDQDEQVKMSFAVPKAHAKVAKDSLRALSWLDRSCKAQTDSAGNICLPLTDPGYKHLALHQPKAQDSGLTQSVTPVQNGLARSGTPVQNGPAQSVTPVQNGCSPEGGCTLLTQHSSHASAEQERSVKPNAQETASPDAPSPSGMLTSRTASEHVGPMSDREAHGTSKQHVLSLKQCRSCLMDLMANSVATLQPLSSVAPAKSGMGPAARLRLHVQQLLQQQVEFCLLAICPAAASTREMPHQEF